MPFDQNQLPTWNKEGVEPPQSLKDDGWQPSQKPPADYFNWFFNKTFKALQSLFTNAQHKEEKGQPNGYAALNEDGKVVNADGSLAGGVQSVNNKTGTVTLTASDVGAETPSGAQAKIDAAIAAHSADTTKHVTPAERAAWNSASQKIGDLTTLNTTAKTNLVDAVNELFTNVSNGKIQVRDAITGKGGIVADSDGDGVPTFEELVTGVNGILTGASIKSVQSGAVAIGLGSYADVTISNVDMSKSFVIVEAIQTRPYDDPDLGTVTGKLINNTTLRVMRKGITSDTSSYTTVSYQVVELENIKSIQVVQVVLMSTGTTNINITPVNLNKTFLVGSYMSAVSGSVSTGRGYHWYAFFNSPSRISVRNTAGQGEAILYVVEFN
ncbi:hypothetical protein [Brevibacillus sp. MCWH]|uniref:hypothetical protein n=1 Tax=Brevibacillus sp. MCWH TaxID=2508871 RepID=UPI001C0EC3D2|nr:hypothetical protein [Brevibacillus sp. MCWH]